MLCGFIPIKWDPFLQKVHETFRDVGIVQHESLEEIFLSLQALKLSNHTGEETELLPQPLRGQP
jgi:hypothetical protein